MSRSESAIRRWAEPGAREKHSRRMIEAACNAKYTRKRKGHVMGHRVCISAYVDKDVFATLDALALKQGKPLAELVRTYIDWGLEAEGEE